MELASHIIDVSHSDISIFVDRKYTEKHPMLGSPTVVSRINPKRGCRVHFLRWRERAEKGIGIRYKYAEVCRTPEPLTDPTEKRRLKQLLDAAADSVYARFSEQRIERPWRVQLSLPKAIDAFMLYASGLTSQSREGDKPKIAPQYSAHSCKCFRRMLDDFCNFVGEHYPTRRRVRSLKPEVISAWREYRKGKLRWGRPPRATTLRTEYAALQAFLVFARDRGWLKRRYKVMNTATRRELNGRPRIKIVLEDERVRTILGTFADNPYKYACIYALAATGVRQGELRAFETSDYDATAGTLTIKTQGRERTKLHARILSVSKGLADAIEAMMAARKFSGVWLFGKKDGHNPLRAGDLNRWLRPHKATPHDLRRWFIHTLELAGCPQLVTDYLSGHQGSGVQQAYGYGQIQLTETLDWTNRIDALLAGRAVPRVEPNKEATLTSEAETALAAMMQTGLTRREASDRIAAVLGEWPKAKAEKILELAFRIKSI